MKKIDVINNGFDVTLVLTQYSWNENGPIHLEASCITETEIDFQVDRLIKLLELARVKAKRQIKKNWLNRGNPIERRVK